MSRKIPEQKTVIDPMEKLDELEADAYTPDKTKDKNIVALDIQNIKEKSVIKLVSQQVY